jgi:hypothetical protein
MEIILSVSLGLSFVFVAVKLILNFIIGCWYYTLDRTKLVSGDTSVTVCIADSRGRQRGKNNTGTERERERVIEGGQNS